MIRRAILPLLMLLSASVVEAQNGREAFQQPDTAYDATHAVQRDAFLVLRDSTSSISSAGAHLMSDMTSSSSLAWMRSRSRAVAAACARSEAPLAAARAVTLQGQWPRDNQKKTQQDLLKEMTTFAGDLTSCQKLWTTMAADTSQVALRENAPYQMKKLQDRVDHFNRTARTYLQYISIKLPPPGTPTS